MRRSAGNASKQNETKEEQFEPPVTIRLHVDTLSDPSKKYRSKSSGYFNFLKSKKYDRHLITKLGPYTKALLIMLTLLLLIGAGYASFFFLSRHPCVYLCPWFSTIPKPLPPPKRTREERRAFVENTVRQNRQYLPLTTENNMVNGPDGGYDIYDCPLEPPAYYPIEFPIMDVIGNWALTDTELYDERSIHQGICIFDFARHGPSRTRLLMQNYQKAEKPFVVKNDPQVLITVERWNTNNYLDYLLQHKVYRAEFSKRLSMMYWSLPIWLKRDVPENWVPPTKLKPTTFARWKERALAMESNTTSSGEEENQYLRIDGCESESFPRKYCATLHRGRPFDRDMYFYTHLDNANFLHEELPWFSPKYYQRGLSKDYLIQPDHNHGIMCRFGAKGLVSEDHFDNSRNMVTVLGGERRYVLGHPNNCEDMSIYPQGHPLERHSKVDWNAPNLTEFPNFENVHVNEVVLQAGDIVYLPTHWFHHIVSLNMNYQCTSRSGSSLDYDQTIFDCGFLYNLG